MKIYSYFTKSKIPAIRLCSQGRVTRVDYFAIIDLNKQ